MNINIKEIIKQIDNFENHKYFNHLSDYMDQFMLQAENITSMAKELEKKYMNNSLN
jgi:hypothetical protein